MIEIEGGEAVTLTTLSENVSQLDDRSGSCWRLCGTVVTHGRNGKTVPLFNCELTIDGRPDSLAPQLSGVADTPLPGFGVFTDVSLQHVPRSQVALVRGADVPLASGALDDDCAYLCFRFEELLSVAGCEVSFCSSQNEVPGVVLDPRGPTFWILVDAASVGGECHIDGGGVLAVSAAESFCIHDLAGCREPAWGRIWMLGTIDVSPLDLLIDGELVADFAPVSSASWPDNGRETQFRIAARGAVEFGAVALQTTWAGRIRLMNAWVSGELSARASSAALCGTAARHGFIVGRAGILEAVSDMRVTASLTTVAERSRLDAAGDCLIHVARLGGAEALEVADDMVLLDARVTVSAAGIAAQGFCEPAWQTAAQATSRRVDVALGTSSGDWQLVIRGPELSRKLVPLTPIPELAGALDLPQPKLRSERTTAPRI